MGTHVLTPWPGLIEVVGQSGAFDYIEYVGEYSPWSLDLLENLARAIETFPELGSMVKVEEPSRDLVSARAVDAGFESVLFTDCRNAQDVRDCIAMIRPETPEAGGVHGAGMRRNVGWVRYAGSQDWVDAMGSVVVAIMIEKRGAMETLDEILEVDGVDMVQFGPADYSISVGKPGGAGDPEVQAAQREMVEKALAAGVAPRVELGSFEQAGPWLDLGVRHFCVGWDLRVVFDWCRREGQGMRDLLDAR